ncbi:MAG: hypothetical protein JWM99_314 [Verrucomicrobiales bacterium]|nr:hypothetical protein [Verrucomicrobiales bacterium]
MHLECHATLGWLLGNLWGGDRKIRNYAVLGSILPDVDALSYIFGPYYYGMVHCNRGANAVCQTCGRAVCPRHLNVRKRWRIVCSDCGD